MRLIISSSTFQRCITVSHSSPIILYTHQSESWTCWPSIITRRSCQAVREYHVRKLEIVSKPSRKIWYISMVWCSAFWSVTKLRWNSKAKTSLFKDKEVSNVTGIRWNLNQKIYNRQKSARCYPRLAIDTICESGRRYLMSASRGAISNPRFDLQQWNRI